MRRQPRSAGRIGRGRDRRSLSSSFFSTYLTLLSIIQGTTLAMLFAKVDDLISKQTLHLPQLIAAIGIFLTIVLLWHQYLMAVTLFNFIPSLAGSSIPFLFGLSEFGAIVGLERGIAVTLLSFGIFWLFGVLAIEYQYFRVRRNTPRDALIHRVTRGFRLLDDVACIVSAVVLLGTALLLSQSTLGDGGALVGSWVVIAVAAGQALREQYTWSLAQRRLLRLARTATSDASKTERSQHRRESACHRSPAISR